MGTPWVRDVADRQSVGQLLGELTDGGAQLVRDEIRLARAETVESLLALRRGTTQVAVGVAIALCGGAAAVAGLIMVISTYLLDGRTWLAAFIVSVIFGGIGWVFVWRGGRSLSASSLAPRETATSIKETAAWLKHPTRSVGK